MATSEYDRKVHLLWDKIRETKAILIGAGAGLSAAAGLDYSGPAFRKAFSDYIRKYGFTDLYSSSFYDFPTEEERWARWARHIVYARYQTPARVLYKDIFSLVAAKEYFVITTNVDGQFIKSGFDPLKLFEVQGDYGFIQCAKGCHNKIYGNEALMLDMVANTSNFAIPTQLVPACPVCGGQMDVHVRKNQFFVEDAAWDAAAERYEQFINRHSAAPLLLLELGVGFNTPGIIRYPFEEMAAHWPQTFLARINNERAPQSPALSKKSLVIDQDINKVVHDLISMEQA